MFEKNCSLKYTYIEVHWFVTVSTGVFAGDPTEVDVVWGSRSVTPSGGGVSDTNTATGGTCWRLMGGGEGSNY